MKILSISALLAILFLASCSKKSTPTPTPGPVKTGTVIINGTTYPTIIIGNQIWTSLSYTGGTSTFTDAKYGNYYTLDQVTGITLPTGWRIPTRADFNNLLSNFTSKKNSDGDFVGDSTVADKLAADTAHFKALFYANNASGFSAWASGLYYPGVGKALNRNLDGVFLSSTTATVNSAAVNYIFALTGDNVGVGISTASSGYYAGLDYNTSTGFAYAVRFVKDN